MCKHVVNFVAGDGEDGPDRKERSAARGGNLLPFMSCCACLFSIQIRLARSVLEVDVDWLANLITWLPILDIPCGLYLSLQVGYNSAY
jgi:hypothetical protein